MARVTILVFSALLVLYMQIENANSNMLAKQIKKKAAWRNFNPFHASTNSVLVAKLVTTSKSHNYGSCSK